MMTNDSSLNTERDVKTDTKSVAIPAREREGFSEQTEDRTSVDSSARHDMSEVRLATHAGLGVASIVSISVISSLVVCALFAGMLYLQYGGVMAAGGMGGSKELVSAEEITPSPVNEDAVISAVAAANPAVVSIIVTQDVPVYEDYFETYDPFGGMFGPGNAFRIPRRRESGTEEREVGGGSGFFVSSDGLVVTNRHVVALESARYSIVTTAGDIFPVEVVARDPLLDIAVLRVTSPEGEATSTFPSLTLGDSSNLRLGQTVIAIGNALGEFRNSVSVGVVSGLSRSIIAGDRRGMSESLEEVIQTDAAINPGNSGGPLLNSQGDVIGVNVAVALGSENIGFALPVNTVKAIVSSIETFGEIRLPFLGVRYVMLDEQSAASEELPIAYGAYVSTGEEGTSAVEPNSPASVAGIQEGDVIIEIGGISLQERSLANAIRTFAPGETVEMVINRGGNEIHLHATLGEYPKEIEK